MRIAGAILAGLLAIGLGMSASNASAREATPEEKAQLNKAIEDFATATRNNDTAKMVDFVPPRIYQTMASRAGLTLDTYKAQVAQMSGQVMKLVTSFTFSVDPAQAKYAELKDGTPYAVLPSVTKLTLNGQTIESSEQNLAMLDGGRWYLMRTEATQVAILVQVYPEFAGVSFAGGSTKVGP